MRFSGNSDFELDMDELIESLLEPLNETQKEAIKKLEEEANLHMEDEITSEDISVDESFSNAFSSNEVPSEEIPIVLDKVDKIRKSVLPHAKEVMEIDHEAVFDAIETALHMIKVAFYDGLDPLIREGEYLSASDCPTKRFLSMGLEEKAIMFNNSIPRMLEEYEKRSRNIVEDYISYLYIRSLMAMYAGLHPRLVRLLLRFMLPSMARTKFDETFTEFSI